MNHYEIPIFEPGTYVPMMAPGILGVPDVMQASYTAKQRQWFLRVYDSKCHFPTYSERYGWGTCGRREKLEIHHITPSAWIKEQMPETDPNSLNYAEGLLGIALCKYHHDFAIHPDVYQAIKNYGNDKGGIKRTIDSHHEKAKQGEVFWNTDYDEMMKRAAEQAIMNYVMSHPCDKFPTDPKWKGKTQ